MNELEKNLLKALPRKERRQIAYIKRIDDNVNAYYKNGKLVVYPADYFYSNLKIPNK